MRQLIVWVFLLVSVSAYAQMPDGPLDLKGGRPVLNGEVLKGKAAIIGALGDDFYQNSWKKAASLRKTGLGLTIAGSAVLGYGLAGYVTALCTEWPEAEVDPERYALYSTAFSITKGICAGGVVLLGAGIPLLCIGNSRLRGVCEQYNLSVSTAPGGLALRVNF